MWYSFFLVGKYENLIIYETNDYIKKDACIQADCTLLVILKDLISQYDRNVSQFQDHVSR